MSAERRRLLAILLLAYLAAFVAAAAVVVGLPGRSPLVAAAMADLAATLVVFAFGVIVDNSSVYDPYWSVAPVPIVLFWAHASPRSLLVVALVAAWAVRLTGNCLVRWRSLHDEDFRYAEIRGKTGRLYWPASLFAIHLFPTAWVFLGLWPLQAALARTGPLRALDAAAALVTALAIAIEGVADWQLRRFLRTRAAPDAVLDTGLWALCRHPNYLGEILFWWGLFLFGLAGGAPPWTGAGALAITGLFVFVSAPWMDRRMEARHPGWLARRAGTPSLLPRPTSVGRGVL